MKLKTLAAMCKRDGVYCLYDRISAEGEITEQWLGTHAAVYPLSGLPYLTEENIAAMFDLTEKQLEKIYIRHDRLPTSINFDHIDTDETMLDREKITLGYSGRVVRPLFTRGGLEFIDADFLAPLADVADDLELYERHTPEGGTYFAAKMGLMIAGVIMPLNILEAKFVESMEQLSSKCRTSFELKEARKAEREAARRESEGEQTEIDGEE
ncbi:MAG: hypothetical protein LBD02_00975 [Christensenellaceae bacterium]|jgi:hypothetical protein|nr:hypothetical protein [Christensenellaceae bacterium]